MRCDQIAINSVSTSGSTLEERLEAYAGAGFKNVEFMLGHVKDRSAGSARSLIDATGLKCIGGFESAIVAYGDKGPGAEKIVANANLLAELGGKILVVGTDGPSEPVEDPLEPIVQTLRELAEAVRHTGVRIALEFNWSPVVKSLRTAVEVARRVDDPVIGVLFDPAHYHCTPSKFEQLDTEAVSRIFHVHVNDMRDKPGEMSHCNADRVLPGEGCLDLPALFGRMEQLGYDGYYSIEMFSDELWACAAADAATLMYKSMLTLVE
jgi:4-hydroxyphenylpyruvate dioxygenase